MTPSGLDRVAARLRRATLIPVLLLVPLIFLPLRNPSALLADRALNVALHLGATLLVFALARRLGSPALVAPATALLFAVHPVHVEAVATAAGRTDLLATSFSLAALLSFTHAGPWRGERRIVSRPRRTELAASVLAGACLLPALAASPVALAAPLLMLFLEWSFRPESQARGWTWWQSRAGAFAPSVVAVAAFLVLRAGGLSWALRAPSSSVSAGDLSAALALLARQVGALFYPLNLSSSPLRSPQHPPSDLLTPLPLLGTTILLALIWLSALPLIRRRRGGFESRASFAALMFLLPYCGLAALAIGQQFLFSERSLYFPSIGFCLLLSLAIGAISTGGLQPGQVRLAAFTLAALILGFSILTWARCLEWRDVPPPQEATSPTIRVGENGSSCAGELPSTIQRES